MTEALLGLALRDSVDEVLAKMFFTEPVGEFDEKTGTFGSQPDDIVVALRFEGDPPGSMCLHLTSIAAREIAADFLGIEQAEISPAQVEEVARELANMICGSVLSRVESGATFQLGPPQIVAPDLSTPKTLSIARYCVQLSQGRLCVNIGTGT